MILPPLESAWRFLSRLFRRHPLVLVPLGLIAILVPWLWVSPPVPTHGSGDSPPPEVISTFVEDPQRTIAAMRLWREMPGSSLVLQGRPSSQQSSLSYLRNQNLWPRDTQGLFTITEGCDTFGQITALSRWLKLQPRAGRLTLLTSDAHLERTMAITRIMIEPLGWTVEGVPVSTGDHRPENIWRLYRDQFRARLWRLTGWGAAPDALCREREEARSR